MNGGAVAPKEALKKTARSHSEKTRVSTVISTETSNGNDQSMDQIYAQPAHYFICLLLFFPKKNDWHYIS